MEVLSDDVSTFLVLAPEEEYLGAKVQGFIPREDGGLSALEMHGQVYDMTRAIFFQWKAGGSEGKQTLHVPFVLNLTRGSVNTQGWVAAVAGFFVLSG